ncbi:ATP-binding protein [Zoogloea sp.]|uniref:ATP-binding protein n=1 Tax=Zoogloea sp. TaxID=49181 RepID=UPI0014169DB1|nr:MAG: PAS domain S-box protein [Zoogloea sp.]
MRRSWKISVAVLALLGSVIGADIYFEYHRTAAREEERLTLLANALDANIGEQLRATSRMMDALREDIPGQLAERDGVQRVSRRMTVLSEAMTGIRTLLHVDAEGVVVASNRPQLIGMNFGGSERYSTIRESHRPDTLYVSRPFNTPLGSFTISLGKTLSTGSGAFEGYLLAIVDPDFFGVLMRSMLYAPDMRLSVAHADGQVVYSTQTSPDIRGVSLSKRADSPFVRHMQSGREASFIVDVATATGDRRFFAIRTVHPAGAVADKPLVIAVSRDVTGVFAEWRHSTMELGALYAVSVIGTLAGLRMLGRRKHAFRSLQAEKEALKKGAEEKIQETNEQFRAYFNNVAVGAVQLDADGRYQLVNDRYCEMTGYSREEMTQRMRPSDITHPDDVEGEGVQMQAFWSGESDVLDIEKRIVRKGGGTIWVHVFAHAVRDERGQIKFSSAVIEDITHRRALMHDLEDARERAEAANRAKTLFLGNMSHEMRTPLHHIAGVASLFRRDPLTEKQSRRLAMLESGVKRLDTVIGGILTLVDIESRSTSIRLRTLDMEALIGNVAASALERALPKGLQVTHHIGPLPEPLMGDPAHISTILACFCNNAVTFSEKGTIHIRVMCVSEEAGSALVRFEVQDEGIGVAREHMGRLFEHFEQADNSNTRRYGGTGVGLAIVRQLARMMGGDAGCDSVQGEGSTFWASVLLVKGAAPIKQTGSEDYQI